MSTYLFPFAIYTVEMEHQGSCGGGGVEEGAEVASAVVADGHLDDAEADNDEVHDVAAGAEAAGAEGCSEEGHECGKWCGCLRKSHTHDGAQQRRHPINLLIRHLQQHVGNARTPLSLERSMPLRRAWTLPTTCVEADVARAWGSALDSVLATKSCIATSPLLDGAPQNLLEIYSQTQAEMHSLKGEDGPSKQQEMNAAVEDMARMCVNDANGEEGKCADVS